MGAAVMKIRVQLLSGRDHVFEVGNDVDIWHDINPTQQVRETQNPSSLPWVHGFFSCYLYGKMAMFGAANMKTMLEQADTLNTKTCFGKAFSQKLQGFSSFRVVSTFFYYSCCFFWESMGSHKIQQKTVPQAFFLPKKRCRRRRRFASSRDNCSINGRLTGRSYALDSFSMTTCWWTTTRRWFTQVGERMYIFVCKKHMMWNMGRKREGGRRCKQKTMGM